MAEPTASKAENRLLVSVPANLRKEFSSSLERVFLGIRHMLYELGQPIRHVYFPIDCVVSVLANMDGEESLIEVATVGNEGMAGLPVFLGADSIPGVCFSQVPGEALRMTTADFKRFIAVPGPFTRVLHRYTQALMVQISQGTGCNRAHSTEQRFARWLLQTHDRVHSDEFVLTQEFLGQMLGVRRATVGEIAAKVQQQGILEYSRGRMRILRRPALERLSCHCYAVIRDEYDRLLDGKFR